MTPDAQTFIAALHALEADHNVERIADLFAPGAHISNPLVEEGGHEGAQAFWTAYRESFDTVRSEFTIVLEQDGRIALEWATKASAKGRQIAYEGVSMIEAGEGGVTAFRTYFDPSALGRELTDG